MTSGRQKNITTSPDVEDINSAHPKWLAEIGEELKNLKERDPVLSDYLSSMLSKPHFANNIETIEALTEFVSQYSSGKNRIISLVPEHHEQYTGYYKDKNKDLLFDNQSGASVENPQKQPHLHTTYQPGK
jgi:hypothetical protein